MYQGIGYEIQAVMGEAANSGLLASLCTVMQPDGLLIGAGQPSGDFVAVPGASAIPCMDAPRSTGERLTAGEQKAMPEIQARIFRHVLLGGYYGDVIPWGEAGARPALRAVVTGPSDTAVTYEVVGVESDSQQTQTRLALQMVTN